MDLVPALRHFLAEHPTTCTAQFAGREPDVTEENIQSRVRGTQTREAIRKLFQAHKAAVAPSPAAPASASASAARRAGGGHMQQPAEHWVEGAAHTPPTVLFTHGQK